MKIIDRLEDHRSMAPHVWNALDLNLITTVTDDDLAAHLAAFFPDKVKIVKAPPDPWLAAWLVSASKGKFTSVPCDKVHGADTSALVNMLCFACMLSPTLSLPTGLLNKVFCSRLLDLRYLFVGSRLLNFEKCIKEDGSINWLMACAFDFQWSGKQTDSRLEQIRHRFSNDTVTIPAHHTITEDNYTLMEP